MVTVLFLTVVRFRTIAQTAETCYAMGLAALLCCKTRVRRLQVLQLLFVLLTGSQSTDEGVHFGRCLQIARLGTFKVHLITDVLVDNIAACVRYRCSFC